MKLQLIMAATIALAGITACANTDKTMDANGEIATENSEKAEKRYFNDLDFSQVKVAGNYEVYYTQNSKTSVMARGRAKDLDRMEITVTGKALKIGSKKDHKLFGWSSGEGGCVKIYISSPHMSSVSIAGSGSFSSKRGIDTETMKVSVAGSGDVDMGRLTCGKLSADIAGSGEVSVDSLTTQHTDISIAGSGDVNMGMINGGKVEVSIAGSGEVELKGRAKSFKQSVAGSGDIDITKLKIY